MIPSFNFGHIYLWNWNNCNSFTVTSHQTVSVCKYVGSVWNFSSSQFLFRPPRLYLRSAISMQNYPTELHNQTQNPIFLCSLSHIPLFSPLPVPANILSPIVWPVFRDFWFWLPHVQNCFLFKHINQNTCRFCLIYLVKLTVQYFYILYILQNFTNSFLYLWKICAFQPTRRDLAKCYKFSRWACVHT